jgi:hypothetical protein
MKIASDWIWGFFLVMALYLVVRPTSTATGWIADFTTGLESLIQLAVSG